jgi:hypothetical protein
MQRYALIVFAMLCYCLQMTGQQSVLYKVKNKIQVQQDLQASSYVLVTRNKKIIMHYYDADFDCFHVQYKDIYGIVRTDNWLNDAYWYPLKKNPHITDSTKNAQHFLVENIAKLPVKHAASDSENARRLMLIRQYGYTEGLNIATGKLWLGMTAKMALDSWGIPYQIKRTNGNFQTTEQWNYSHAYLYFEDGILTEIFRIVRK